MLRSAISRLRGQVRLPYGIESLVTYVPLPGDATEKVITLIPGDGIGPEVTDSTCEVLAALGAPLKWEIFSDLSGSTDSGHPQDEIPEDVLDSLERNRVCLKGTLVTPLGRHSADIQSLNVQLRKKLDLHVNLVHGFSIPGLVTRHSNMDIVVIRENTEGEYSGLEHEVVPGVVESLKVITEMKSLRTARYAFEFAFLNNRKKVTAVHKANIMKLGDGQFIKACRKLAKEYPNIDYEEMIVDNTCMQLVSKPEQFDVMVTPNLYGNLVCNVVAGLCGGYGVCPGGNVGDHVAIFEQGARQVAADLAGKNQANPTAMLLSGAMMLRHLKLHNFADRLERAVYAVYGQKDKRLLTPDVGGNSTTKTFSKQIIRSLQ
eukprot:g6901.t1